MSASDCILVISSDENWYYYYFYCVQLNWSTNAQRNERRVIHRSFVHGARAFVSLGQKRAEKLPSPIDSRGKISTKSREKLLSEVEESHETKCIDDLPGAIANSSLIGRSKLLSPSHSFDLSEKEIIELKFTMPRCGRSTLNVPLLRQFSSLATHT